MARAAAVAALLLAAAVCGLELAAASAPFIEMRIYKAKPEGAKPYSKLTDAAGNLRCTLLPFLGAFTVETGALDLNSFVSFYFYRDFSERDALRKAAGANADWAVYADQVKPLLQDLQSSILQVPAGLQTPAVQAALASRQARAEGKLPAAGKPADGQASTYLLRTYRVPAGTAAALLSSSSLSLPASNATAGELLFIGSTSIGSPARGSMVELWRFRSAADALAASQLAAAGSSGVGAAAQAAEAQQGGVAAWARALARAAPEAADSVQQAEVVVLRPAAWSNWQ